MTLYYVYLNFKVLPKILNQQGQFFSLYIESSPFMYFYNPENQLFFVLSSVMTTPTVFSIKLNVTVNSYLQIMYLIPYLKT